MPDDRLRLILPCFHPAMAQEAQPALTLRLARMLRELMPDEREVYGVLALLLVTDARRGTRVDAQGQLVRLQDQDRSQWDRQAIAGRRPEPSRRSAQTSGPEHAPAEVERLERVGDLDGYQYLPAVKADLLRRLGRGSEASAAYARALELTQNEAEREFLMQRLRDPRDRPTRMCPRQPPPDPTRRRGHSSSTRTCVARGSSAPTCPAP